jgi:hypothetical protein
VEGTPRVERKTRPNLSWLLILAVAGLSLFVFACAGGTDSPPRDETTSEPAHSHEESEIPVVHVPARWATGNASDLRSLVASSGTVFVGRIAALKETRVEDPFGGAGPSGDRPGIPVSVFEVRVETSLAGEAAAGSTVVVEQVGGVLANPDGSRTRFVLGGDQPLAVGERHLFFAARKSNGSLAAAPFERFEVSEDGTLASATQWAELGAVHELSGRRVEEARREIAEVGAP